MTSCLPFFSGTATVAGALVGLLFVALSVARSGCAARTLAKRLGAHEPLARPGPPAPEPAPAGE